MQKKLFTPERSWQSERSDSDKLGKLWRRTSFENSIPLCQFSGTLERIVCKKETKVQKFQNDKRVSVDQMNTSDSLNRRQASD